MSLITLADVASPGRIRRIVDHRRTPAWTRAGLRNPGSDGLDTYTWMTRTPAVVRGEQVREALLEARPWLPLLEDSIPKAASWKHASRAARAPRRFSSGDVRHVNQDARVDHARQLALAEVLGPLVENRLSRIAVAYRPGKRTHEAVLAVLGIVRDPARGFRFAATVDIRQCFDEVPHDLLDAAVERHLAKDVEDDVLRLVKALYRVSVVTRDGRVVSRTKGIPQGLVLAPMLLNLFLADIDRNVQKQVANLGCVVRRYCDDMLVLGSTVESVRAATAVIERELARLRLKLKPETKSIRDLQNPQNHAVWLGFAFTKTKTWVPRERVERKAAELLDELMAGRNSVEGLDEALTALRSHYGHVLHPEDAERAVESIRKLLAPFLGAVPKRKEGVHHLRRQIASRAPTRPRKPGPPREQKKHKITLLLCLPSSVTELSAAKGKTEEQSHPSNGMKLNPGTPPGGSPCRTIRTTAPLAPAHLDGGNEQEGMESANAEALDVQAEQLRVSSSFSIKEFTLAAPEDHRPRASPSSDQAAHRRGIQCNVPRTPGTVRVAVKVVGKDRGRITFRSEPGYSTTEVFRLSGARSAEEVILAGYRRALRLAAAGGVNRIVLRLGHPTIEGHVTKGWAVRSPEVMRAWERLLDEVDRVRCTVIASVGRDGKTVDWRLPHTHPHPRPSPPMPTAS